MSKRSKRKNTQKGEKPDQSSAPAEKKPAVNEPWLSQSTGLRTMAVVSLMLAAFMAWQLQESEGLGRAILWGLGFGGAIWLVFLGSLAFNRWLRRR
jgi:hypothetical protein